MNYRVFLLLIAVGLFAAGLIGKPSSAIEIITLEDIKQEKIPVTAYVKAADNGLILFDNSASMRKKYKETGESRVDLMKDLLIKRAQHFPALDINIGLYVYTPWDPIYPVQPMKREMFVQILKLMPTEGDGLTLMNRAFEKLDPILAELKGRTAVFVMTDGKYTREGFFKKKHPAEKAQELADKYDICFYLLSAAEKEKHKKNLDDIAAVNECSRVIPLEVWLDRPEYNSNALYVVKSTEEIVTVTEERIVGIKTDDILFDFANEKIAPQYQEEIDAIGTFLQDNPQTFVVIHGYADNQGDAEYNMKLSHRRAEAVASRLRKGFNLPENRMVIMWYGDLNPVASNDTKDGRARNRRAEIAVGGLSKEAP